MSLNIGKLENDSLEKAVDLVEDFLAAGSKAAENGEIEVKQIGGAINNSPSSEVWDAWNLLMHYGDLGDTQDMFPEFVHQYNTDRGYDD